MTSESDMNTIHKILLEMMNDLVDTFERNDVLYYLSGGCVLGALRHKGFIPWDDDIDIAVFKEDIPKLDKALSELDPRKYEYQKSLTGSYTRDYYYVSRIGTTYITDTARNRAQRISIEIHILHPVPDGKIALSMYHGLMKLFMWESRIGQSVDPKIGKWIVSLMRMQSVIMNLMEGRSSKTYYEPRNQFYKRDYLNKDVYGTPKVREFEGMAYNCPEKAEEMLTKFYGDYMTLPPEEKRRPRSYKALSFDMDYYDYIQENRSK